MLVTSGPTRAWLDRVRYIANSSTGALGARIVEALIARDVPVRHIRGFGGESPAVNNTSLLEEIEIPAIGDLIEQIQRLQGCDDIRGVVHAMAVLDYVPESAMDRKRPSSSEFWDIRLIRMIKVTSLIRKFLPDACMIGFKLEAGVSEEELISRAEESLEQHNLDLVVANDLDYVGPGSHTAIFVAPGGKILHRASSKEEIAAKIAEFLIPRIS